MANKLVRLCGSHRTNNFGDTLLAYLFGKSIADQGYAISAQTANAELRRILDVERTSPKSPLAVVFHGGGYFGEPPHGSAGRWAIRLAKNYIAPNLLDIAANRPLAILGVGVGPITTRLAKFEVRGLFNRAEIVTVRDLESKAWLEEVGVTRPVSVFPDLAIATSTIAPEMVSATKTGHPSVCIHLGPSDAQKTKKICQAVRAYATSRNIRVIVIDDHEGDSRRGAFCEDLVKLMEVDGVGAEYIQYKSPKALLGLLAGCRLVITDKLHVGICSVGLGVPVAAVPKHPKTSRFYNQIGLTSAIFPEEAFTPNDFLDHLLKVEQVYVDMSVVIKEKIEQASGHLDQLKLFLNSI